MLFLDFSPATENVIDVDEADSRKLVLELTDNLFIMDTVAEFSGDALPLFGIEEVEIAFRQIARATLVDDLVHHGNREFGQQTDGGHDAFHLLGAILLGDATGLRFKGNQDVTDFTLHESGGCSAASRVENRRIVEDFLDEFLDLRVVALELFLGVGRGGEIGVTGVTGGLRIGKTTFTSSRTRSSQSLIPFGVAGADKKRGKE